MLKAIVNGAYFAGEKIGKMTGCVAPPIDDPCSPQGKAELAARKKRGTMISRTIRAIRGSDFKTNVKDRKGRKDIEKKMVTQLGGKGAAGAGAGGKRAGKPTKKRDAADSTPAAPAATMDINEEDGATWTTLGPVQNVKGQVLELDLYDYDDGGIFDADDFLGRVLIPLERVLTVAEGGDKKSMWLPWKAKDDPPVKGEICIRAYFPDPEAGPSAHTYVLYMLDLKKSTDVNTCF